MYTNIIGWCTYYTCLKRLSTFFTIVATGTDYYIWMTGSLPGHLRLHLLASEATDAIMLHIWYKDTKRKDVYRVGDFPLISIIIYRVLEWYIY